MSYFEDGPLMNGYDPNWEKKFNQTQALIGQLENKQRQDWTDDAHSVVSKLHGEIPKIFLSQFRTVLDYEKFLREQHWFRAKKLGLRLPDIRAQATEDEVSAAYQAFRDVADRVESYQRLPKPEEWGNGLFALDKPDHVQRVIETVSIDIGGSLLEAHLIIEHHSDEVHVCVVEDPLSVSTVLSPVNGFGLAKYLAGRMDMKKAGKLGKLFARANGKAVFVYKFFSPLSSHAPGARVYPCRLVFDNAECAGLEEMAGIKEATPLMMEELLKLDRDVANWAEK
ncbi:hypothetical protein H5395_15670 [Paracoccus sp. MC1854]|uniref:hypothetical protein n=1 Tax=Paracoccus sp. MC1854 TaxID=2760306 RepID=UPI0015FFDDC5|nr:hypothetical protein [Paracoccus sp. MC1854]MBB1492928.1 hypothetical protein [Paracoccus sp. MC1854]